jgi:hypothetical protein
VEIVSMTLPDPIEPSDAPVSPRPLAGDERPDWLLGAEAVDSEGPIHVPPLSAAPRLRRPGAEGSVPSPAAAPPPKPRPVAWTAAASSVPQLKLVREPAQTAPFEGFLTEDENDPHARVEFPEDSGDSKEESHPAESSGPALRPLYEPWWIVWLEALATSRRLQMSILAVVVVGALYLFWPKGGERGVSIASLKRHPETFNGQTVRVQGKIGEVFVVGQGYAFDLHQGRDTVVVFTQTRTPRVHERVDVVGQVSTGYLDGMPRIAVFEQAGSTAAPPR